MATPEAVTSLKECCKCRKHFPIENFNKDKTRKDGLNPRCKMCYSQEKREYWERHGERVRVENVKRYWKDPEKSRKMKLESRNKDPQKDRDRLREERKRDPRRFKGYHLKRDFGITLEIFDEMHKNQNYLCKICNCKNRDGYKDLAVDHCHATGKIRGLLCENCNKALGMFKDSISILENAINYLKDSQ